jgi:iron complex outermembrane recepter protein
MQRRYREPGRVNWHVVILLLFFSVGSARSESLAYEFDIQRQEARAAVQALAAQSGLPLLFHYDLLEGRELGPVIGRASVQEALHQLLQGTGLVGALTDDGVITIRRSGEEPIGETAMIEAKESRTNERRGLGALIAAFLSAGAAAQGGAPADTAPRLVEEVVVTGSRMAYTGLSSPSPVTVLEESEINMRGVLRVEDLLSSLPQALAGQGAAAGIASGTATVNLRGLGSERTLVLVNGRRLPYGSPTSVAADLNQVPSQLIERVEVLTGGASAVYGADAIAGVVNFITKRNFEGLEISTQGSAYNAQNDKSSIENVLAASGQPNPGSITDGESFDLNVLVGGNFAEERGNITAHFGYSEDRAVRWEDRDITACPLGTTAGGTAFTCQGSGALPQNTRFVRSGANAFNLAVDSDTGALRAFDSGLDAYNFAGGNYLQRPRERWVMGTSVYYNINENMEWFADYSFMRNSSSAQIAASGLSPGRTDNINCDNPLLSDEQQAVFCNPESTFIDAGGVERAPLFIGRRNIEGGPRENESTLTTHRIVTGLRGEVFGDFDYEVFAQYSNVDFFERVRNDIFIDRAALALDVVTDPATGTPVCRAALSGQDPDCLPWNVFTPGGIDVASLAYLTDPILTLGQTEQFVVGGSVNGSLERFGLKSPLANEYAQIVLGFEYREDSLELTPDTSGGFTVIREPVEGKLEVYEVFSEIQLALLQDKPLAQELTYTGAFRFSDYTETTGTQNTFASGLSWQPVNDIRLRAQFQRAIRSPNPVELFSSRALGRFTLSSGPNGLRDPCSGDFDPGTATPSPARSLEDCALTGVTGEQYGQILDSSTGEFNSITGGNPDLNPEESDTWTLGFVYTPEMLQALTVSVDYFDIQVDGFVGTVPPEFALESCLNSGDPFYCGLISRDSTGSLWLIDQEAAVTATNINTGTLITSGVDLNLAYSFNLGDRGDLGVQYIATWVSEFEEESLPGATPFDCAGYYGGACGAPRPDYRHRLSFNYESGGRVNAKLTWRYVSEVDQFGTNTSPIISSLKATSYFDLSASYTLNPNIEFRVGVNNLLDQDPPLTSIAGFGGTETSGRGNTYPQIYDAQGRFLFAGVTASF